MKCPSCSLNNTKTIESRPSKRWTRRRRACLSCEHRFTTYELYRDQAEPLIQLGPLLHKLLAISDAIKLGLKTDANQ